MRSYSDILAERRTSPASAESRREAISRSWLCLSSARATSFFTNRCPSARSSSSCVWYHPCRVTPYSKPYYERGRATSFFTNRCPSARSSSSCVWYHPGRVNIPCLAPLDVAARCQTPPRACAATPRPLSLEQLTWQRGCASMACTDAVRLVGGLGQNAKLFGNGMGKRMACW